MYYIEFIVNITNTLANLLFFLLTPQKQIKKSFAQTHAPNCTVKCTRNEECSLTEACIDGSCHPPCLLRLPCALNAVCVNVNHDTECRCIEGFEGNAYSSCRRGLLPITR